MAAQSLLPSVLDDLPKQAVQPVAELLDRARKPLLHLPQHLSGHEPLGLCDLVGVHGGLQDGNLLMGLVGFVLGCDGSLLSRDGPLLVQDAVPSEPQTSQYNGEQACDVDIPADLHV